MIKKKPGCHAYRPTCNRKGSLFEWSWFSTIQDQQWLSHSIGYIWDTWSVYIGNPEGVYIGSTCILANPCRTHIGPLWASPYGTHIGPILDLCGLAHMGPISSPVALSIMGPMWVAHIGPISEPKWVPYGSHIFCSLGGMIIILF